MRLVLIEWVDAFGCSSSWEEIGELSPTLLTCRSVGWLAHDGDQCKVLIPHISEPHDNMNQQGCGDMTIPTRAVLRVVDLVELDAVHQLQAEIDAFEQMKAKLEAEHLGEWVLFHGQSLVSVHPSFEAAADDGVRQFGRGPFLIRRVGAPPMTLPTSVVYHRPNAER